jgi:two-component SAPR family response regulator
LLDTLDATTTMLMDAGRHDEAIACYRKAQKLDPLAQSDYFAVIRATLSASTQARRR